MRSFDVCILKAKRVIYERVVTQTTGVPNVKTQSSNVDVTICHLPDRIHLDEVGRHIPSKEIHYTPSTSPPDAPHQKFFCC
jgi:hypothetical protein